MLQKVKSVLWDISWKPTNFPVLSERTSLISVLELIELAEEQGANIIHVVNLVDRSSGDVDFGVPSTALLSIPSESWEPENCVLCKQGMAITQRGRSGKEMEAVWNKY